MNNAQYVEGSIVVTFLKGFDEGNQPMYEKRTFKNVQEGATEAALKEVANSIGTLIGQSVEKVERITKYVI